MVLLLSLLFVSINAYNYNLTYTYAGQNFFDDFIFDTQWNYGGYIQYMNESYCWENGLINISSSGQIYMGSDHTNKLIVGDQGRPTVKINSKQQYNGGLFITDFEHMPQGCGVWPAWWFTGPNWPNNGEIDNIEMIDLNTNNVISLHANSTCNFNGINDETMTGKWESTSRNCNDNQCGIRSDNNQSFGIAYNEGKGGYNAFQWIKSQDGGLYNWFWNRNDPNIPKSLLTDNPDPSEFGEPVAVFKFGDNCPYTDVNDMYMVFDIDFCGFADQDFEKQCPNTGAYNCINYVAEQPEQFVDAYWLVNWVKVYQET